MNNCVRLFWTDSLICSDKALLSLDCYYMSKHWLNHVNQTHLYLASKCCQVSQASVTKIEPLSVNMTHWVWVSWASCQIHKSASCACAGNAGNVFPATDFKGNRKLAIPTCITARASRTCRDACRDRQPAVAGKTFPAFPAHAQHIILHIW